MKINLKKKAIRLKSGIKEGKKQQKQYVYFKILDMGTNLYGKLCFISFASFYCLKALVFVLKKCYAVLPSIIHFLEALISTLSYQIKKEFFYELFN